MSKLQCFFFQAEDGIRDGHVTGVQTCALPIFGSKNRFLRDLQLLLFPQDKECYDSFCIARRKLICIFEESTALRSNQPSQRSEERRVGKESRSPGKHGIQSQKYYE